MSFRARLLPWLALAVSFSLSVIGVVASVLNGEANVDHVAFVASFATVQVVGALLLAHQPRNAIGLVMTGLGLVVALQAFVEGYAQPSGEPPTFPWGGVVLTWAVAHTYLFIFVSIGLLFFLFPTGHLPYGRWKPLVWSLLVGLLLALTLYLQPGPLDDETGIGPDNPANPYALDVALFDIVGAVGTILLLIGLVSSLVALVLRYRASYGVTRLQMKWFAAASAAFGLLLAVNLVLRNFFSLPSSADVVLSVAFVMIPLSIGNAILRYRLYEIDVFINRALVYGALSAVVIVSYIGLVVTLQIVLEPVTNDSDLAVAASTLAVAALFRPMRSRVQAFIDRRFYRRKYDAVQTLAMFTRRLRDEVDVDVLQRDMVATLQETVQPSHVAVWLRSKGTT